jgi:dethiobiotin synthetase
MAAEALGRPPFTIADLAAELVWSPGVGVGLVETAGGVRSPLATDGDSAALAEALRPERILLVADAGLGTINAVRLSAEALAPWRVTVVLNRYDPDDDLHVRNHEWLTTRDGLDVAVHLSDLVATILGWPRDH